MKLQRIIEILEVNPEKVDINSLSKIRIKAFKRWHPDTIHSKRPSQETIELYKKNFQDIDSAIDGLKMFIETGVTEDLTQLNENAEKTMPEDPIDIIIRNVPDMQQDIKELWENVKKDKFKFKQEKIVLSEGINLSQLLKDDIKEYVPFTAVNIWFVFSIIALIINAVFEITIPKFSYIPSTFLAIYLLFHMLSCLLWGLPLSRVWMLKKAFYFLDNYVNAHDEFLSKISLTDSEIIDYIFGFLSIFPLFVHFVICTPIYYLAAIILNNKKYYNIY